uniref:Putative Flagellar motor protein MotB n=1 Tax=Magnetococcus massalia (strain MO-1) TaxID=451514 RepID=A0A1S7LDH2_MAGMO|nr:putative Flagellar motor protein MotB [Candidatus Magnetococcus massalia]
MAEECPKPPKCKKGAPGWMVTFGDLMSLLLTFFVLLLSFAQLDIVKFEKVSGSLSDAFGVQRIEQVNALPTGQTMIAPEFATEIKLVSLKEKVENVLDSMIDNGEAEVFQDRDGFTIQMDQDSLFHPGTMQMRQESKKTFMDLANLLNTNPDTKTNLVRVTGHTDNSAPPGGAYPTNWALSAAQASAVVGFLVNEGQVDPIRLQVRAMGEFNPKADNETDKGRSLNRRVEVLISRETVPSIPDDYVDDETLNNAPQQ